MNISLPLPALIALVVALGVLNVVLILSCCLVRQRTKDKREDQEQRFTTLKKTHGQTLTKRNHRSRVTPLTAPKLDHPPKKKPLEVGQEVPRKSPEIEDNVNNPRHNHASPAHADDLIISVNGLDKSGRHSSFTRAETESIYSSSSAPHHLHDQILRSPSFNVMYKLTAARAQLPKGMDLPSSIVWDIGLANHPVKAVRQHQQVSETIMGEKLRLDDATAGGTACPSNNMFIEPALARPPAVMRNESLLLRRTIDKSFRVSSVIRKISSNKSFPPPMW